MDASVAKACLYVCGAEKNWHVGERYPRIINVSIEENFGSTEDDWGFILRGHHLIYYNVGGELGGSTIIT